MIQFSREEMQKRFHANRAERVKILSKSGPIREERDRLEQAHSAKIAVLNKQIKESEQGLFELDNEAGMLCRALNGKTGKPSS